MVWLMNSLVFFSCVCVLYTCMFVGMHVNVHTGSRGWYPVHSSMVIYFTYEIDLLLNLEPTDPVWLASQLMRGDHLPQSSQWWDYGWANIPGWLLYRFWGFELWSLWIQGKCFTHRAICQFPVAKITYSREFFAKQSLFYPGRSFSTCKENSWRRGRDAEPWRRSWRTPWMCTDGGSWRYHLLEHPSCSLLPTHSRLLT